MIDINSQRSGSCRRYQALVNTLDGMESDSQQLRSDLLEGRVILIAGAGPSPDRLGALIERWEDPASLDDDSALAQVTDLFARTGRLDAAVVDLASVFASGGANGLAAAMDTAWTVARAVAVGAMIEAGSGTIVLIAPAADAGPGAEAAAAAIGNLARSLSVEWARFDLRTVAICPRAGADEAEITTLVAWLCSASGTYVSGTSLQPGRIPV